MNEHLKKRLIGVALVWLALLAAAFALHKYNQKNPVDALDKQATFTGVVTAVEGQIITVQADDPEALGVQSVRFSASDSSRTPEVAPGDRVQVKCQFKSKQSEPQEVRLVELLLLAG